MIQELPLLAVTPGEPAGIGAEILLKCHQRHPELRLLAVADPALLRQSADLLKYDSNITEWQPGQSIAAGELPCYPLQLLKPAVMGKPDPANAAYVLETLRQAVKLVQGGHAAALVTGPVHKAVINEAGYDFTGHTEFLAGLAGGAKVVMMLAAPGLRVTLVTTHLPLRDVADAITAERVESTIRITAAALQDSFGIQRPKLQVLGLNPHAGEGGYLGREDDEIIRPVIARCRAQGMLLEGPVPADTAFTPPRIAACDAVVAMYHDQGLPVLKHMGFGHSVNITLGLPFIRSSVDHGTALDLAGSGRADAGSLCEAAFTARRMAGHAKPGQP